MISRFFIDRPIFASVLSIVITLVGGIALFNLPLALYPPISPPNVSVDCFYPGASAQVVAETVAAPIEQQVNGVEGMLYMSSQCTNDGSYNLTVTFKHGMNLNMAQVLVQNRVALAMPLLPDVLKQSGVTTRKRSPDILMSIAINSPGGVFDQLYLSNYANIRLQPELARLPGLSDVMMSGQQDYSMRIWLDPDKLSSRSLTAIDVVRAIREQNQQIATGMIGQPPSQPDQPIEMTISTLGRLAEPEQFGQIIIKRTNDGRIVRLKDVARVELGAKNLNTATRVNYKPSVTILVFQLPDANALETADIVKAKIAELSKDFPPGMQYEIRYDTTPFIRECIGEVYKTLEEGVLLVALVVLLFLQNWRSAVIPLIAVPVAIIGTFAVMAAMGFTLNLLTLFGLVLAIGIVVDDAIVVVEAVEHHMEEGMLPREATIRAMEEVSGPVMAIGLVLSAVFIPCAFISGIVGQFFRQFALTIAASTLISTLNSLTLSPALAAMLLKPVRTGHGAKHAEPLPRWGVALIGGLLAYYLLGPWAAAKLEARGLVLNESLGWAVSLGAAALGGGLGRLFAWPINRVLSVAFGAFNHGFRRLTGGYAWVVKQMLRGALLVLLVYGGLLFLTYRGFMLTPKGFIPSQDMGYFLVNVQLPDAAALERSQAVMNKIERIAHSVKGVRHTQTTTGQSMLLSATGSNYGSMFIMLDNFDKRTTPDLSGDAIAAVLRKRFAAEIPEAIITVLGAPPLRGVGRAGGFKLMVEDRAGDLLEPSTGAPKKRPIITEAPQGDRGDEPRLKAAQKKKEDLFGLAVLQSQTENLTEQAAAQRDPVTKRPRLVGMTSVFRANVPQLFVDVNRTECMTKQVPVQELFSTLQIFLGSLYVNDFNRFGRTWQVIVQADATFRNMVEDVKRLKVRNSLGKMVPIGSLAQVRDINGPVIITRYNMYTAAPINGSAAPGVSSGEAIALMEKLAKQELPSSMAIEWTELAYLELLAGNTAMIVFGFAVVMVFLVLAAQYESWALPLAVILVVPLCLLCSITGVQLAGQDINIFTQIGFVVLVGLACKNAILIVEFAARPAPQGDAPARGGGGGLPAAAAADRDDLAGLHPGRGAAPVCPRRRRGDAAHSGHDRFQRHGRRDHLRCAPDAHLLRLD